MEYEDEDDESPPPGEAGEYLELAELILEGFPSLLPGCIVELLVLSSTVDKDAALQTRIFRIIAR